MIKWHLVFINCIILYHFHANARCTKLKSGNKKIGVVCIEVPYSFTTCQTIIIVVSKGVDVSLVGNADSIVPFNYGGQKYYGECYRSHIWIRDMADRLTQRILDPINDHIIDYTEPDLCFPEIDRGHQIILGYPELASLLCPYPAVTMKYAGHVKSIDAFRKHYFKKPHIGYFPNYDLDYKPWQVNQNMDDIVKFDEWKCTYKFKYKGFESDISSGKKTILDNPDINIQIIGDNYEINGNTKLKINTNCGDSPHEPRSEFIVRPWCNTTVDICKYRAYFVMYTGGASEAYLECDKFREMVKTKRLQAIFDDNGIKFINSAFSCTFREESRYPLMIHAKFMGQENTFTRIYNFTSRSSKVLLRMKCTIYVHVYAKGINKKKTVFSYSDLTQYIYKIKPFSHCMKSSVVPLHKKHLKLEIGPCNQDNLPEWMSAIFSENCKVDLDLKCGGVYALMPCRFCFVNFMWNSKKISKQIVFGKDLYFADQKEPYDLGLLVLRNISFEGTNRKTMKADVMSNDTGHVVMCQRAARITCDRNVPIEPCCKIQIQVTQINKTFNVFLPYCREITKKALKEEYYISLNKACRDKQYKMKTILSDKCNKTITFKECPSNKIVKFVICKMCRVVFNIAHLDIQMSVPRLTCEMLDGLDVYGYKVKIIGECIPFSSEDNAVSSPVIISVIAECTRTYSLACDTVVEIAECCERTFEIPANPSFSWRPETVTRTFYDYSCKEGVDQLPRGTIIKDNGYQVKLKSCNVTDFNEDKYKETKPNVYLEIKNQKCYREVQMGTCNHVEPIIKCRLCYMNFTGNYLPNPIHLISPMCNQLTNTRVNNMKFSIASEDCKDTEDRGQMLIGNEKMWIKFSLDTCYIKHFLKTCNLSLEINKCIPCELTISINQRGSYNVTMQMPLAIYGLKANMIIEGIEINLWVIKDPLYIGENARIRGLVSAKMKKGLLSCKRLIMLPETCNSSIVLEPCNEFYLKLSMNNYVDYKTILCGFNQHFTFNGIDVSIKSSEYCTSTPLLVSSSDGICNEEIRVFVKNQADLQTTCENLCNVTVKTKHSDHSIFLRSCDKGWFKRRFTSTTGIKDEKGEDEVEVFTLKYKCSSSEHFIVPGETMLMSKWKNCLKYTLYPECGGRIIADDCTTCNVTFVHVGIKETIQMPSCGIAKKLASGFEILPVNCKVTLVPVDAVFKLRKDCIITISNLGCNSVMTISKCVDKVPVFVDMYYRQDNYAESNLYMNCTWSFEDKDPKFYWGFINQKNGEEVMLTNKDSKLSFKTGIRRGKHEYTKNITEGETHITSHLTVKGLKMSDAGGYFCANSYDIRQDNDIFFKKCINIIVMNAVKCSFHKNDMPVKNNTAVVNDILTLKCLVQMAGNFRPFVTYRGNDYQAKVGKDANSYNFEMILTAQLLNKQSMMETYSIVLNMETLTNIKCSSMPKPKRIFFDKLMIHYGPINYKIVDLKKVYTVGDILRMYIEGNPRPNCTWYRLNLLEKITGAKLMNTRRDGCSLSITLRMVGNTKLMVKMINFVGPNKYKREEEHIISIFVKKRKSTGRILDNKFARNIAIFCFIVLITLFTGWLWYLLFRMNSTKMPLAISLDSITLTSEDFSPSTDEGYTSKSKKMEEITTFVEEPANNYLHVQETDEGTPSNNYLHVQETDEGTTSPSDIETIKDKKKSKKKKKI